MKERPILFNDDMVRAILAGQKTQTRRPVDPQRQCPFGQPGDRLWVRETLFYEWHMHDVTYGEPDLPGGMYSHRCIYRADNPDYPVNVGVYARGWTPSIHMPRILSRITLEITDVRVERVRDISEEDAQVEGVRPAFSHPGFDGVTSQPSYRWGFWRIWDELYAARGLGWSVNPWVWVVTFKRVVRESSRKAVEEASHD